MAQNSFSISPWFVLAGEWCLCLFLEHSPRRRHLQLSAYSLILPLVACSLPCGRAEKCNISQMVIISLTWDASFSSFQFSVMRKVTKVIWAHMHTLVAPPNTERSVLQACKSPGTDLLWPRNLSRTEKKWEPFWKKFVINWKIKINESREKSGQTFWGGKSQLQTLIPVTRWKRMFYLTVIRIL